MSVLKSLNLVIRASRFQILNQHTPQLEVFRGLYAASSLGLDGFMQHQQKVKQQLANIQVKFRAKMNECTKDESKNVVFTEDLKNMVHLAEAEDVDVVIKMMKKFNQQSKELRFGNFIFGPVVMRMFHVLNKPDQALECFKSPELQGFFDQLITYQLLLDMLYENQRYNEVLECTRLIVDRQVEGTRYPRNIVVLAYAACYKLNTPESVEYGIKFWEELARINHFAARRATTFFVGLLLNHNKPEVALEVLSSIKNQNYTTIRNLKILALTRLNRLEDTIPVLKSILDVDEQIQTFNPDVLDIVRGEIEKSDNIELQTEFNHIVKIFKEQKQISENTLEEQLTSEITSTPRIYRENQDRPQQRVFNRPRQTFQRRPERAALRELE